MTRSPTRTARCRATKRRGRGPATRAPTADIDSRSVLAIGLDAETVRDATERQRFGELSGQVTGRALLHQIQQRDTPGPDRIAVGVDAAAERPESKRLRRRAARAAAWEDWRGGATPRGPR